MKVKVLNLDFEIIEVPVIEHGSDLIGRIEHLNQKIFIQKDISEERKKIVLLHEILHSIFQQLGFVDQHDDEHLINSLSSAFYQVLKDNKTTFS